MIYTKQSNDLKMKNNIALCLFTSTKGHFDIKTRYQETVKSLNRQVPIEDFGFAIAHIKVSEGEDEIGNEMQSFLESYGFTVIKTNAEWKHHNVSHQRQYLNDMFTVFSNPRVLECESALFLEDDMLLKPREYELSYYMYRAGAILKTQPDIISVRIPRFENEKYRIGHLREKHQINSCVIESEFPDLYFYGNDFSNNPHFCRPRDIRNALILMNKNAGAFMIHSEMGLGPSLKYFSDPDKCIAVFNPSQIVSRHIGTIIGEEELIERDYFYE